MRIIMRIMFITTAQLHLTQSKLRFRTGSNPVCSMTEIHDGVNL